MHSTSTSRCPRLSSFFSPFLSCRDDILAYNFDEQRELLGPLGASEAFGEAGFDSLERLWHRPTLEVVGLGGE